MDANTWPEPSRLKTWTDANGHTWHRVGHEPLSLKAARRAFADNRNVVVHFYGVTPRVVSDEDARTELWSRVELAMRGRHPNPHADVKVIRYRDEDGGSMLAVEESC